MAELSERDAALLLDMLLAALDAQEFVEELDEPAFLVSRLHQNAAIRSLEVLGEAAGKVSAATQATHPEIPWREITGMRHRLIHGYGEVRLDLVWMVLHDRLGSLIRNTGTARASRRRRRATERGVVRGAAKTIGQVELRKFTPYPAYKDSGVEWLREVPAGCEAQRGDAAAPSGEPVRRGAPAPLEREEREQPRPRAVPERHSDLHRRVQESAHRAGRRGRHPPIQDRPRPARAALRLCPLSRSFRR